MKGLKIGRQFRAAQPSRGALYNERCCSHRRCGALCNKTAHRRTRNDELELAAYSHRCRPHVRLFNAKGFNSWDDSVWAEAYIMEKANQAVLLVQGGAVLVRWMRSKPSVVRILLAVGAAVFAPALASFGQLLILVPLFEQLLILIPLFEQLLILVPFVSFLRFYVLVPSLRP